MNLFMLTVVFLGSQSQSLCLFLCSDIFVGVPDMMMKNYNSSFAIVLFSSRKDGNLLGQVAGVSSNPRLL